MAINKCLTTPGYTGEHLRRDMLSESTQMHDGKYGAQVTGGEKKTELTGGFCKRLLRMEL
jgi:hypothetical protein